MLLDRHQEGLDFSFAGTGPGPCLEKLSSDRLLAGHERSGISITNNLKHLAPARNSCTDQILEMTGLRPLPISGQIMDASLVPATQVWPDQPAKAADKDTNAPLSWIAIKP